MKYISLILLTVFLSSPCFAEKWVFRADPNLLSSLDVYEKDFTDEDSNWVVAVPGNFGNIRILPAQVTKGHISIEEGGEIVTTLSPIDIIEKDAKKAEAIKFVEWNFIVPENYHEKGILTHPKSFAELYAQGQKAIKYELETAETPEIGEIIYQAGSFGMPFYQGILPLGAVTKSGPNGGGGAGAYKAQFFSWEQGAMSQELIQQFVEAMEEESGGKIEIIPFYFNSPAVVASQLHQGFLSERELEAVKKGFKVGGIPRVFFNTIQKGEVEFDLNASVAKIWADNEDYAEELRNAEMGLEVIVKVPESSSFSSFGFGGWAYGNTGVKANRDYDDTGIFSYKIKDYSSMEGMMLIGPNGGGGAGAYMLGN